MWAKSLRQMLRRSLFTKTGSRVNRRLTVFAIALLAIPATAWPADTHANRFVFEGLDCIEERFEVFVRALAAAQLLGYETRDVDNQRHTFSGWLKTPDRRVELSAEVGCSDTADASSEGIPGSPGVVVDVLFRAKRGGRAAAQAEAVRFETRLRHLVVSMNRPKACLGISVHDVASLEDATRAALGVESGFVVAEIHEGGPAAAVGIQPGDVLLGVDGMEIADLAALGELLRTKVPGDEIVVLVLRDSATRRTTLVLGRREMDGTCATMARSAELAPAVATTPSAPSLTVSAVELVPQPVAPGAPFDVQLIIDVLNPSITTGEVDVTLRVEILRGGEVLYTARPETVRCTNRNATNVVKHLKAGRDAGSYEVRLTVEEGSRRDQRTVSLEIR